MGTMSWEEVISLVKAYKAAVDNNDEEAIAHICNVLPDEIVFSGDDIIIRI